MCRDSDTFTARTESARELGTGPCVFDILGMVGRTRGWVRNFDTDLPAKKRLRLLVCVSGLLFFLTLSVTT